MLVYFFFSFFCKIEKESLTISRTGTSSSSYKLRSRVSSFSLSFISFNFNWTVMFSEMRGLLKCEKKKKPTIFRSIEYWRVYSVELQVISSARSAQLPLRNTVYLPIIYNTRKQNTLDI